MSSRLKNLTREFGAIEGTKFYIRLKTNKLGWFKSAKKKIRFFLRNNGTDPGIFGQVFIDKQYEYPISFEPETILDLGANTGLSALYFADRFKKAKIIALENGYHGDTFGFLGNSLIMKILESHFHRHFYRSRTIIRIKNSLLIIR